MDCFVCITAAAALLFSSKLSIQAVYSFFTVLVTSLGRSLQSSTQSQKPSPAVQYVWFGRHWGLGRSLMPPHPTSLPLPHPPSLPPSLGGSMGEVWWGKYVGGSIVRKLWWGKYGWESMVGKVWFGIYCLGSMVGEVWCWKYCRGSI